MSSQTHPQNVQVALLTTFRLIRYPLPRVAHLPLLASPPPDRVERETFNQARGRESCRASAAAYNGRARSFPTTGSRVPGSTDPYALIGSTSTSQRSEEHTSELQSRL